MAGDGGDAAGDPDPDSDPDPQPDADPDPDPDPEPAAPEPTVLSVGEPLAAEAELLAEGAFIQVVALPHGDWVAENVDGVSLSEGGDVRALGEGPEGLTDAAAFGPGVLLATGTGLWFAGDAGTALSPLDEAAPGATSLAVDGDDLWLAGASGLHLWREGQVSAVTPEGLDTEGARIAGGGGVLWVSSGDSLWRLWSDDSGWRAEVAVEDDRHRWLAGGKAGVAWASTGATVRRAGSDSLAEYAAPEHQGLAVGGGDVWLWDAESLLRLDGETLWPVQGVSAPRSVAALGDGGALVAGETGLFRVVVGEPPEAEAPTWGDDVLPIFDARCDICHGERGNARRLDDIQSFSDQVDLILAAVREQRMPLPPNEPLTDDEIDLIVRWQEAEFPE